MTTNEIFLIALKKLLKLEGKYVNDPVDKGGETYCGISRNYFPKWIGWNIIDHCKNSNHFAEHLKSDFILKAHVEDFYKTNFWNKMHCDFMPPKIGEELFELSVNTGIFRATFILQTTLNILNKNEKLYKDILVDGRFGKATLATLRTSLNINSNTVAEGQVSNGVEIRSLGGVEMSRCKLFFNVINILQGSFYIELMLNNPVYEKYIGWFNRVEVIK